MMIWYDRVFRVQRHFTLLTPFAPCLFMGENTGEGLPKSLALSLLVTFYEPQGIWWWYSCSPHHRSSWIIKNTCIPASFIIFQFLLLWFFLTGISNKKQIKIGEVCGRLHGPSIQLQCPSQCGRGIQPLASLLQTNGGMLNLWKYPTSFIWLLL